MFTAYNFQYSPNFVKRLVLRHSKAATVYQSTHVKNFSFNVYISGVQLTYFP